MRRETIHYQADGLDLQGQLLFEDGARARPGILVFPEAFGIGDHSIARAERLARLGYVALACDLHGDGLFVDDLAQAMAMLQPLFDDPRKTRTRAMAALQVLAARPEVDGERLAAIGFCFPMPIELARAGAPLRAVVGFHTALATRLPMTTDSGFPGALLACIGGDDPFIPAAQRLDFEAEMRAAGVDWQLNVYGNTVHSFTNAEADRRNQPGAIRYSAESDAKSWGAMLALFESTLGGQLVQ